MHLTWEYISQPFNLEFVQDKHQFKCAVGYLFYQLSHRYHFNLMNLSRRSLLLHAHSNMMAGIICLSLRYNPELQYHHFVTANIINLWERKTEQKEFISMETLMSSHWGYGEDGHTWLPYDYDNDSELSYGITDISHRIRSTIQRWRWTKHCPGSGSSANGRCWSTAWCVLVSLSRDVGTWWLLFSSVSEPHFVIFTIK